MRSLLKEKSAIKLNFLKLNSIYQLQPRFKDPFANFHEFRTVLCTWDSEKFEFEYIRNSQLAKLVFNYSNPT